MTKKLIYYVKKLNRGICCAFSIKRIRKFGIKLAVLDFISFLCHRSGSDFQHMVIRSIDRDVQEYIYNNYENILKNYKD